MPKTNHPLTRAKTSPGVSYTVPDARLVDTVTLEDSHLFVVALDDLEEALLDAAAREVIEATVPGYRGDYELPIITWRGRTCLRVHGQFPPTLKGPDGKPRKTVKAGATVTVRVMLKRWPTAEGLTVVAFPSRIDVHGKAPLQAPARKTKAAEAAQLDMVLVPPAEPVAEPAPITTKATKAQKPKPAPKPKPPTRAKAPAAFDKAAFAAHRARVIEARARQAAAPKPPRKTKNAAPALPENVIVFPIHRARKPSRP